MTFSNISLCGYATHMIKAFQPKSRVPELTLSWPIRKKTLGSLSVCCRLNFLQAIAKIEFGVISIKERVRKQDWAKGPVKPQCRPNKILANPVGLPRVSVAQQSGPHWARMAMLFVSLPHLVTDLGFSQEGCDLGQGYSLQQRQSWDADCSSLPLSCSWWASLDLHLGIYIWVHGLVLLSECFPMALQCH